MLHKCIYCEKEVNHKVLSNYKGYDVVKCLACNLISLCPLPADLKKLYDDKYFLKKGYEDYEKRFIRFQKIFTELFKERLKMINKYKNSGKVLDIGCAHGFLLNYLKQNGFDCYGLDISDYAVSYAKNNFDIPITLGDIDDMNYPEDYFDVIMMLDVIEHVKNPLETLKKINKYLKKDGIIIIQTPFDIYHWEIAITALLNGRKIGTTEPSAIPMHLYFFTPKTFKNLALKANYKISGFNTGTYGKIRMLINPPDINNNPLRYLYYKMGLRFLLTKIAELFKISDGMNLILEKK